MKLKVFFVLIPALITAIVVSALLLFSASWIQVAIAVIPIALILYVTASQLWAKLVRPVSNLAEQTRPLTEGDLTRLVVMNKEGEFGEITSNINSLVRKLREAQEREDRFHAIETSAAKEKSIADELRLSYDNLLVVSELGQKIIASLHLRDIASTTFGTLNTMMDAASFELATIDPSLQQLNVILSIDLKGENESYSVPLDSPSSFGAWTAVHGREVFLEDVETNYARYIQELPPVRSIVGDASGAERIRSLISIPMFTKGTVIGVMAVGSYRKGAFSAYHLDMLKSLALYIAVALDNAESYQKLDRALIDLKTAQRQLVQAEKMSSLGLLTAGIAHEINNPINFVSANIGPLRRNLTDVREILDSYRDLSTISDSKPALDALKVREKAIDLDYTVKEITALLDGIEEGAHRTAEIVQGLRNFSRTDEQVIKLADLHQGIDSTLTLLHNKYKDHVEIIKNYGDIPEIECFAGQLNQVFMNILSNAIQAIVENKSGDGNGKLWIRTRKKDSHSVEIRFKDSGTGMPEEVRKQVFDPFFTTKDVGVGTGLGLSISYGIIEKHGGTIEVESEFGRGTEFIITLPIEQKLNS
jgi:signal transduction histidine kinase/HAMP domain-containing protein